MSTSPEPIGNNIDNPDNPDNPNNLNNPNISNYPNNPNYPNACPIGDNNPSQDEEEEEKEENFASALGDGYFPIPEAKGVCRGERLGEGARVYASAKRFATEKEVKQILQKVDAELVSTRMACYEKGYTQIVYEIPNIADLRKNPLDGMMTAYWQKSFPKGRRNLSDRAQGKLFKVYITNRSTLSHDEFQKRQSNKKQCRCLECREQRTAIQPFRGRITAFQADIDSKVGYVLYEFMGDERDVFVKKTGSAKLSDHGRARVQKVAVQHKPGVGAAKHNATTMNSNAPLSELASTRQVSSS
jgi:hypothetical protein